MPRAGDGTYSKPAGTAAEPNETITSSQFNDTIDDLVEDANAARPLTAGGTGATTAADARANLDAYGKDSILGTVAQTAGVPTGAVIQRGSNSNGAYVRFADGTQICTHAATFTFASVVRVSYEWTFPVAFAARPFVTATLPSSSAGTYTDLDDRIIGNCQYSSSAAAPSVSFVTISGSASLAVTASVTNVALFATGRWF